MSNELYTDIMLEKKPAAKGYTFHVHPHFDAVWMSQDQLASFFDVSRKDIIIALATCIQDLSIDKKTHIRRISYVDKALSTASSKQESQYSLSIICQLAFYLNSVVALDFRRFSVSLIERYLLKGSLIDPARILSSDKRREIFFRQSKNLSEDPV